MNTTPPRSAAPGAWPACRTRGPITTRRVIVLNVIPIPHRLVRLRVALGPTQTMTVVVPDLLRGLQFAEAACRTGAPIWMTALVVRGQWVPVLFRQRSGDPS
jgi:hypothetical protein